MNWQTVFYSTMFFEAIFRDKFHVGIQWSKSSNKKALAENLYWPTISLILRIIFRTFIWSGKWISLLFYEIIFCDCIDIHGHTCTDTQIKLYNNGESFKEFFMIFIFLLGSLHPLHMFVRALKNIQISKLIFLGKSQKAHVAKCLHALDLSFS